MVRIQEGVFKLHALGGTPKTSSHFIQILSSYMRTLCMYDKVRTFLKQHTWQLFHYAHIQFSVSLYCTAGQMTIFLETNRFCGHLGC